MWWQHYLTKEKQNRKENSGLKKLSLAKSTSRNFGLKSSKLK